MQKNEIVIAGIENLSKQELQEFGRDQAIKLMAEGWASPIDLVIKARKASELLTSFVRQLDSDARNQIHTEHGEMRLLGCVAGIGSTGDRLDLDSDPVYSAMKKRLKERESILKLAAKSDGPMYDGDACSVPKLRLKSASKETLRISF